MKKEEKIFKAETKELLNLMIHSIYTNKEIFLRELISNANDAIDKLKFQSLTDTDILKDNDKFRIDISVDKDNRTLTISDNGIGMTYEEVDDNIGTIAKSGSKLFKEQLEEAKKGDIDIIGQFGVGFYSGFIVADKITLETKSPYSENGVKWISSGDGNYEIEEIAKQDRGTKITLHLKDGDEYNEFLEDWKIKDLVKKYSNYIRYEIYFGDEVINSTKPIWKKDKKELKDDDYNEFYKATFHDWNDPLLHINLKVQGNIEYNALLFIPKKLPFDYYTKNFKRGLQLYTKNVFIMEKCEDLIPEYFNFISGLVDCDSLSLNISREILQQNAELQVISKNLEKKITSELEKILKNDREKYVEFWKEFGRSIKAGVQDMFGMNKEKLQDLLIFVSSHDDKYTTLKEYVDRMGDNKEILYVPAESVDAAKYLPKMEKLKEQGREVLILTDKIDEFTLMAMRDYSGKEFKSINSSDFKFSDDKEKEEEVKKIADENKELIEKAKEFLKDKVSEVELSNNIGNSASSLLAKGGLSLEMEKTLSEMTNNNDMPKAEKVLAINPEHVLFNRLKSSVNTEDFNKLVDVLYNQALLLEGFNIENPAEFIKNLNSLIK
ncbi:molecular chaperone HtpG [Fusobacterium nucleatum subsp. nucleatum ATCC 25586]|uniref:Chaperone protein HtpG n=3 Tax=Fusobacterium nucleatum subsp. nucleatum TaxID=76856 RepID=HTPG_FUSNN|nr:molecular chaperone HtpG [Fusobacterium nucleatum]Q8RGH4.1 RecName: Full=Chaperone protein HtpG; AltName: Full=Heat shock protein HtpG; AltName: Full=High temperature protein G [Fusobacterium nucleatum subsp. nucleatum ATCC 25586]AAL94527.1 Heat shock protein htpG [Fusobacterium nucleatum subsp. nucleatum ATCC 25586]AVQ14797.1 molecular chaperone HtpG [Fusobacterium nucleatum subsp. nucleatum ATCC 25586]KUL98034.1 molecular chaperone HtpG [Fusobacterium nucleatum subsp. nucleatum]WMS29639.1